MDIESTPQEILIEIFQHLPKPDDLHSCHRTSKKWRQLIDHHPQIWQIIAMKHWKMKETVELCSRNWMIASKMSPASVQQVCDKIGLQEDKSTLYIDRSNLRILPTELFSHRYCEMLTYLELSRNDMEIVPDKICTLINLRTLYLDRNRILRLPENIGNLPYLIRLDLHDNQLTQLPLSMTEMWSLRRLSLYGNNITWVHPEFSQLTELSVLTGPSCHWPKKPDPSNLVAATKNLNLKKERNKK
eukprot:TRINITY_DN13017_c0_g1_i1.p1 TRINITY_DN13017_c0_g1~~TRINITY_DN13017_c0_g1_i1.p1  ORF type:complete len:244 (-),score=19.83 TRINITY_DN13017_c0_g1_i1:7-738(-)